MTHSKIAVASPYYKALTLAATALVAAAIPGQAAPLTWSPAASGTWNLDTGNTPWSGSAWTNSSSAIFAGPDGAVDSYVITLDDSSGALLLGAASPQLTFSNTGYILTASSAITLGTDPLSASTAAVSVAAGKTATIGSNVNYQLNYGGVGFTPTIEGGGTLNIGKSDGSSTGASLLINATGTAASNFSISGAGTVVNVYAGGTLGSAVGVGVKGGGVFVGTAGAGGTSTLNVTGGSLITSNAGGGTSGNLVVGLTSGTGVLNVSSGTVTVDPTAISTAVTVPASASTQGGLRIGGGGSGATGIVNLDGGILTAPRILKNAGSATLNFNGGTLQANAGDSAANYLVGLNAVNVLAGGATIDSNGFNITVGQALGGTAGANRAGGLTKQGAGTLTLSQANVYAGPTAVQGGMLKLASGGSIASTAYSISNNAIFDVSSKASYSLGGISLAVGTDGVGAGLLNAGTIVLTLGGNLTVDFTSAILADGSVDIMNFGSKTGDFTSVSLSGSYGGSLTQASDLWTGSTGGYDFSFDQTSGVLSFTAVPEPSTYALFISGMLIALVLVRRQRRMME